jgi:UDP-N-acetylmuramate: L-alanyl-gamma-D-glutamyl-meso-diaminopimelate ligase
MGRKAKVFDNMEALVAAIASEAKSGDQILVMSNGGFGGIHQKLLTQLAQ